MNLFPVKSNENTWLTIFSDFASLFFPSYCLGCSVGLVKGEEILCTRCVLQLPRTGYSPADDNPIKEKFIARIPVKYAGALLKFRKAGIVQRLLHQLKYNHHPEIGIRLGKVFGDELKKFALDKEFDLIVPMPLHPSRQRRRGYNQSTKFAVGVTQATGIPNFESLVVRHLNTSSQTRKNKTARWENVKNAFRIPQPSAIQGQRILLVDDIITTGASMEACGQQLLDHGCKELSVAVIAEAQ